MPVKRRLHKGRPHRVTPDAIEAFRAGDKAALHRALGLKPWQPPVDVESDQAPHSEGTAWAEAWPLAVELRQELMQCR